MALRSKSGPAPHAAPTSPKDLCLDDSSFVALGIDNFDNDASMWFLIRLELSQGNGGMEGKKKERCNKNTLGQIRFRCRAVSDGWFLR